MMVNGLMELKMVKEFTMMQLQKLFIKANGKMVKKMFLEFLNFHPNNITKEHLSSLSRMGMELKYLSTETNIKENIAEENSMVKENTPGQIHLFLKGILIKV
jgi:hypothetical protein